MVIYGAIIIPIITVIYLLTYHKESVVWWEILLQFGVSVIVIVICVMTAEMGRTKDTEIWGDLSKKAEFYEKWDEYIHKTCSEQYPCGQT